MNPSTESSIVESGRYQNVGEAMRESLKLIEHREAEEKLRLRVIRNATATGIADIEAGRYRLFSTPDAFHEALSLISAETLKLDISTISH